MCRVLTGRRVVAAVLAALALTLVGCGDDAPPAGPSRGADLRQGGTAAFDAELRRLRGRPVVVNQWASWCTPCKAEFPFFRREAQRLRGRVAFLGVNSMDSTDEATRFLRAHPTPFPHFEDQDAKIARSFRGGRAWPTTAYYTADGELNFTHQGSYRTQDDLARDIQRYAIDG